MNVVEQLDFWFAKNEFNGSREGFYEDLAEAIADNEGVAEFLRAELENARRQKRQSLVKVYTRMLHRMEQEEGRLSYMLETIVPPVDVLSLKAVDEAENKVESLLFVAESIKRTKTMGKSIRKALAAPLMIVPILAAFAIIISLYVMPEYEKVAHPSKWPMIGRILYAVSIAIKDYGLLLLGAIAAIIYAFKWSMPNWVGGLRFKVDTFLPYSLYRDYQGATFLVTFSTLLRAKQGMVEALSNLRGSSPPWVRWHINRILKNMTLYPEDYSRAFSTGIFSPEIEKRLASYARRSSFNEGLIRLGSEGVIHVQNQIEKSSAKLNFAALLIAMSGMMFFYGGSLMTSQGLTDIMKQESNRMGG